MAVLVKNASLAVGDQTLYTGVDINKVGATVDQLVLNRLLISTSSPTSIDIYARAWNRATNAYVRFDIIQALDLRRGSIINVIPEGISLTTSYSIYLAHTKINKSSTPSSSISYYFDYAVRENAEFVNEYNTLNH